ncbi:MAG: hypothetical protein BJ554DRAFT_44 [Olpidium bornovanus]|uniref:Phosphatidylinositol transfer protein N-terminal domain-containing protein n=1 Tax=Olpidium bornovanus TaxID=278681 RepID=A0A8H7ZUS2_9FUNG|nr:MAG: hypothetical protein BJ554DRAFT_44 [Olpidium bornovanus]
MSHSASQPFNHTTDEKAKIEIVLIDIANDPVDKYKFEEDPKLYKSEKSERGPLEDKWIQTANPMMTCYKKVTVEFKWYGLQTKIENFIHKVVWPNNPGYPRPRGEDKGGAGQEAATENSRQVAGGREKNASDLPTNPSK